MYNFGWFDLSDPCRRWPTISRLVPAYALVIHLPAMANACDQTCIPASHICLGASWTLSPRQAPSWTAGSSYRRAGSARPSPTHFGRSSARGCMVRLISCHPVWRHPHPWYMYGIPYTTAGAISMINEGGHARDGQLIFTNVSHGTLNRMSGYHVTPVQMPESYDTPDCMPGSR